MKILNIFSIIFLFGSLSNAEVPEDYVYRNVSIGGGGFVTGVIYHPAYSGLVYCRTDVGGAYRWLESDKRWLPLTDHLGRNEESNLGVLSLALDPNDPERVYLLTGLYTQSWAGTGAVLISANKGATWTKVPLSIKIGGNEDGRSTGERLVVDPNKGNILFLGSSTNGLWKSENYGASWSKVSSFPVATSAIASGGISFVMFDPTSSLPDNPTQIIYVGVLQKGMANLFRSIDGGANWEEVPGHPNDLMPHHTGLDAGGNMYISYCDNPGPNGVSSGAVYKLDTNNDNWTMLTLPAGQGGFAGLAVDRLNPGTVMVSTMNRWWPRDEIYRSNDGGVTWRGLLTNANWDYSSAPYAQASNPHWIGDLAIDPFNADKVWFVTGYGVWFSNDISNADSTPQQKVSWSFENKGLEETVPLELKSPSKGAFLVSALGDIDGFRHENLSISPAEGRLSPRYGTNTGIDFGGKKEGVFVRVHNTASGNYGAYSENGGVTWTKFATAPTGANGGGKIAVSADGSTFVWRPGGKSIHYSTTKGSIWTPSTGVASLDIVPVADRVNPLKIYACDALGGKLLRSVDGGASFSTSVTGLPIVQSWLLYAASIRTVPGFEGHIWLNSPSGLYFSDNSGSSFLKIANINESLRISFGKGLPDSNYPTIFMAGTVNGVQGFYRSDDIGVSWNRINDGNNQYGGINDIAGDLRHYGRFYIATSGRGVIYGQPRYDCDGVEDGEAYYDDCDDCVGGTTGKEPCDVSSGIDFIGDEVMVKVWPNPFVNNLNIEAGGNAEYTIYSQLGQVVETGNSSMNKAIGKGLSPGVYFLEVLVEGRVYVVRIVKI